MPGPNDPKDKKIAETLARAAEVPGPPGTIGAPLAWNLHEDGSFVLVLVQGPKLTFSADEVAEAMKPKAGPKTAATKATPPEEPPADKKPPAKK